MQNDAMSWWVLMKVILIKQKVINSRLPNLDLTVISAIVSVVKIMWYHDLSPVFDGGF